MRLSSELVDRTLTQFEAVVLPDELPAMPQLNRLFGDHTFFVDTSGLSIVEPAAPTTDGVRVGQIVNLANWNDADDPPSLAPHDPQPTDVVVVLGPTN
jgi:hypothetical protein